VVHLLLDKRIVDTAKTFLALLAAALLIAVVCSKNHAKAQALRQGEIAAREQSAVKNPLP